jgi:AraC-like DNA-binding protein
MSSAWPLVDAALRGALAASVLLIGAVLVRDARSHPAGRIGIALMAGLAVQAFATLPLVEQGWPIAWQAPLVAVSVGNAVLFWLFARALFDDEFSIGLAAPAIWLAVAALGAGFCLSLTALGPQAVPTVALKFGLRWAPAVFALATIAAAASHWRGDLIERRRRLRAFIVVAGSAYALAMVALRVTSPIGVLSDAAARFDAAALLAVVFVSAVAMLRLGDDDGLLPAARVAAVPAAASSGSTASPLSAAAAPEPDALDAPDAFDAFDARLAEALERLMAEQRAYRVDDLTLGVLALKLSVPEYRLRRFIHHRLGHRNFSAYVNGLRLAEARATLADPARRDASVLEIAAEAGFASIGPFNRAFKATSGVTPSEFRRRALASDPQTPADS